MSDIYYHLRITLICETQADEVVSNFILKNNQYIERAIFAYEYIEKPDGKIQNHHIHGHIQYKPSFELEKIKYYLKTKHPKIHNHTPLRKEPENNELYVCKECRIIKSVNYTEEQLNTIKQKNEAIEEDKEKDPKQKLIELLKKKHKTLIKFTMNQLLEEIKTVYIMDWDKFPPPQCRSLCEYITVKEIHEYTKNPKIKKNDFGDEIILVPPLAKSWQAHCEYQFKDNQNPDSLDWEE